MVGVETSSSGPQATPSKTQRVVGEVPGLRPQKGQQGPWLRVGRLAPWSPDTRAGGLPFRMGRGRGDSPQGWSAERGLRESVLAPFLPPRRNLGGGQARGDPLELGVFFLAGE